MTIDFVSKYFWREAEWWFIWDSPSEIPMVVYVNDMFFNIDTIFTALYYDVKQKDLFERYDNHCSSKDWQISFHNFCIGKWYNKKVKNH